MRLFLVSVLLASVTACSGDDSTASSNSEGESPGTTGGTAGDGDTGQTDPTAPDPTEPDPTDPDPTDPADPDPSDPNPSDPDPTDPNPTDPDPTDPVDPPDQECLDMVGAAQAFLDGLSEDRRADASFDWNNGARTSFQFLPPGNAARNGLSMRDMTDAERVLLETFLGSALSATGKDKVDDIRALEALLGDPPYRDPENYFIWFFGTPNSESDPWGYRFEGHHLSLHTSAVNCRTYSATPVFWGSSPNTSPFSDELAALDTFWSSLSSGQRSSAEGATTGTRGADALNLSVSPYPEEGLSGGALSGDQQAHLLSLIHLWTDNLAAPIAAQRRQAIADAGMDNVWFVRNGNDFHVQGPTFLIEFNYAGANHVHSTWRDFDGDWGEDLMARHLDQHHSAEHHTH